MNNYQDSFQKGLTVQGIFIYNLSSWLALIRFSHRVISIPAERKNPKKCSVMEPQDT